jgi:hypothetical protein
MRTYVGKNTRHYHFALALLVLVVFAGPVYAGRYVFSVEGTKTLLNGQEILVKGLRCSNALVSHESTAELIANLDTFASYGVNTISVYFMGSRFGGKETPIAVQPVGSRMAAGLCP